jgi:hypothetical protein
MSENDTRPGSSSERSKQYERLHRSPEIRAEAIRLLETLAELYPGMRLGQILANAVTADFYYIEDDALARALDQLRVTYSQFRAAGIKP